MRHASAEGEARQRLERARAHIVSIAAVGDVATRLGETNLRYGLAKMHFVQEQLGHPPDATFVATPDMTTPRQATKWHWGLAMGGWLRWGDGLRPLVFLDLQVGTSTVLVGGLAEPPVLGQLVATAHRLAGSPPAIMGVPAGWDYAGGNHFINLYRVRASGTEPLPPYVFVLHGGGSDVKRPSALGVGLDYEASEPLRREMTVIGTPWGSARVLTGGAAHDYHAMYLKCLEFSKGKQRAIAAALFGSFSLVSHTVHHGLDDVNSALLGCSRFTPGSTVLFPLTLRPDLPAYLVRGRSNIDRALLEGHDLTETARHAAGAANILPHGGGYAYPGITALGDVLSVDNRRYYVLDTEGGGKRVVSGLTTLAYAHRGLEVVERMRQYGLAEVVAELELLFSLTT